MSNTFYEKGGLRFWDESEIIRREEFTRRITHLVYSHLSEINNAWNMVRCEGPILTPQKYISSAYDENDVFFCAAPIGDDKAVLRPETTPSSYLVAQNLLRTGKYKTPLIVWQIGKSFRRETTDGASPSKLRFNEFYQLEFQCIYRVGTKADYRAAIMEPLMNEMSRMCGGIDARIVSSDRLPSYSELTDDIELMWKKSFKEVCSVSTRTDFVTEVECKVLEIAIGMDRLICISQGKL